MGSTDTVAEVANRIAEATDTDILLFNGDIQRPSDIKVINLCRNRNRRKNVLLVLVTSGGDADAAYRIARCLQSSYGNFTAFVPGWCKSAGTLLAIGANRLVISEFGELGPLDVQMGKTDELFDYSSGLDLTSAIQTLEETAFRMFEGYMLDIKTHSGNRITFKTASEISVGLVVGLLSNTYSQIDPVKIGETARSMTIAKDYGKRLALRSSNLADDDNSLDMLVSSYSSHGFVIDFDEAQQLFANVERPTDDLRALQEVLGDAALHAIPHRKPFLMFLNEELGAIQEALEEENVEQSESQSDAPTEVGGEDGASPDPGRAIGSEASAPDRKISSIARAGTSRKPS
ncbi:MAG: hypothetical protein ACFCUW_02235 [Kiloniellaceae bacterium]